MKVLIIEDEKLLADSLKALLESKGFEVEAVYDGESGAEYAELGIYDLLILDVMIPGMDGYQVARHVRAKRCATPILMLTAKSGLEDRIEGLNAGADYYLTKPFDSRELLARIRVMLRKPADAPKTCYKVGDLEVHLDTHEVYRGGKQITLSGKEFSLLRYMVQNVGIVLSRDKLEQHIWNYDFTGGSNVIDVYIRYLRKKIDEGQEKKLIHTVRGAGYVLKEQE